MLASLPSSDRVAIDDHVRFSGGSDSCSRMETSGATKERGICWEATVIAWIGKDNDHHLGEIFFLLKLHEVLEQHSFGPYFNSGFEN